MCGMGGGSGNTIFELGPSSEWHSNIDKISGPTTQSTVTPSTCNTLFLSLDTHKSIEKWYQAECEQQLESKADV